MLKFPKQVICIPNPPIDLKADPQPTTFLIRYLFNSDIFSFIICTFYPNKCAGLASLSCIHQSEDEWGSRRAKGEDAFPGQYWNLSDWVCLICDPKTRKLLLFLTFCASLSMSGDEMRVSHYVKIKVIFALPEMLAALRGVSTLGARAFSSTPPSVWLVFWCLFCYYCDQRVLSFLGWKSNYVAPFPDRKLFHPRFGPWADSIMWQSQCQIYR